MRLSVVLMAILVFAGVCSSAAAVRTGAAPIDRSVVRVAIYRGPASCDDCSEALMRAIHRAAPADRIDFVGPDEAIDVTPQVLSHYAIYVQPGGGQDIDAALRDLGPARRDAIRSFVRSGGGYLGICMGAYLADGANLGLVADLLDSEVRRPGSAARSERDMIVPVTWGTRTRPLYYQDGPFLPPPAASGGFLPIATYGNGDVAAARYAHGRGIVVLSGPHPEADASWYADADLPPGQVPRDRPIALLLDQFAGTTQGHAAPAS